MTNPFTRRRLALGLAAASLIGAALPAIAQTDYPNRPIKMDWVDAVLTLEHWLTEYVGPHYQRWAWTTEQEQTTYEACVAFK